MFLLVVFVLLVAVIITVLPGAQFLRMKLSAYAHGLKFMFFADDLPKEFIGSNYIHTQTTASPGGKHVIRVVFIRHGQSVWNSLFNTFDATWPIRFVYSVVVEIFYVFRSPFESNIIDTPLTSTGRKDAVELAQFIQSAKGQISFNTNTSLIVCSNLRRAMETAVIGLGPRIAATREKIVIDSSLQEGSRNIDSQTLSTEKGKIAPCTIGNFTPDKLFVAFDAHLNAGNRTSKVNVFGRMEEFIEHLFGFSYTSALYSPSPVLTGNAYLKEVIVVGHSGYFLRFFQRFLPTSSSHIAKRKKMKNCAVVAFDLVRNESTNEIFIDEESLAVLYRGF